MCGAEEIELNVWEDKVLPFVFGAKHEMSCCRHDRSLSSDLAATCAAGDCSHASSKCSRQLSSMLFVE